MVIIPRLLAAVCENCRTGSNPSTNCQCYFPTFLFIHAENYLSGNVILQSLNSLTGFLLCAIRKQHMLYDDLTVKAFWDNLLSAKHTSGFTSWGKQEVR